MMIDYENRLLAFGKRVAELRKQSKMTQEALALKSGLDRSYLSGVERGQRNIALVNIFKLAEALEIEPEVFFQSEPNTTVFK
jgi:transcriptional regulator with XRE-family HTH domain